MVHRLLNFELMGSPLGGSPMRGLLKGVIDYAGLFPPAKLPMGEAIETYFRYKNGPESWIVNRFLCPANRLHELADLLQGRPLEVGVIGTSGVDLDAFEGTLEADAKAMTDFEMDSGTVAAYEVRYPAGADFRRVCEDLKAFSDVEVFLELPWSEQQEDQLAELAAQGWLGAKGRTGGLEPNAVPSADELAGFLKSCQDLDVSFKLTAGLHQPLRHFDHSVGANVHGFLQIFAALAINEQNDLSRAEMAEILESESQLFSETGFQWNGLECAFESAKSVRELFCGFGSCSIDEPLEGLTQLGFLQGAKA